MSKLLLCHYLVPQFEQCFLVQKPPPAWSRNFPCPSKLYTLDAKTLNLESPRLDFNFANGTQKTSKAELQAYNGCDSCLHPIHSYTNIDSVGIPFLCHLQHKFLAHCGCLQQTYTNPAFHDHHSHSPLLRMHYQEYLAPARITKLINVYNYLIQLPTDCKNRV